MQEPEIIEPKLPQKTPLYLKATILTAKTIGYLFIVFFFSVLVGGGLTELFPSLKSDLFEDKIGDWRYNAIMSFGMSIAALGISYLFRKYLDRLPTTTIGLSGFNPFLEILKGASWAIVIQTLVLIILLLVNAVGLATTNFDWTEQLGFLLFFLFVSIFEEVVFRGYLTSLLADSLHFIPALIISSLLFGLVHVGNADFTWLGFSSIFLGGYLLGLLFLKYQNLYLPIGMHWLWNYYQGNILGFDVSGIDTPSFLQQNLMGPDWLTGGEFGLEGSALTIGLLFLLSIYLTQKWSSALLALPQFKDNDLLDRDAIA